MKFSMTASLLDNNVVTFLLLMGCVAGLVGLFIGLSMWLGPKKPNAVKDQPFECGWLTGDDASHPFPIRYYLVAILFIVFDVEVAFMYPWAVSFLNLGVVGFVSMIVFLAILLVGLYFAIKKHVLDWK